VGFVLNRWPRRRPGRSPSLKAVSVGVGAQCWPSLPLGALCGGRVGWGESRDPSMICGRRWGQRGRRDDAAQLLVLYQVM
jgi:hypothetical protein